MSDVLFSYLQSRIRDQNPQVKTDPGPVITISREYGCPAKVLAGLLVEKLNESGKFKRPWQWISREILEKSAEDLKVSPEYIKHIFSYEDRSMIDEILSATRKDIRYRSDRQIKTSIGKVIRSFGEQGHIVIVGRAGVALTRHIQNSLHIRLQADPGYRAGLISESKGLALDDARSLLKEKDQNRHRFLQYYLGEPCCNRFFDLIINCQKVCPEQASMIIRDLTIAKVRTN